MNKIKWESHYDDLLFDFIQFRSEHPNGNLSDSIKDFKNYMTKEEQPFQVGEKVRFGYMGENYEGEIRTAYYFKETALVSYFADTATQYLEVPFSKLSKVVSQPKTERIEVADISSNWYPNNRLQHTVEIYFYEKVSEEKFPLIKQVIEMALNNEELYHLHTGFLKESEAREEKAFNAGRKMDVRSFTALNQAPYHLYFTFEDYKKLNP